MRKRRGWLVWIGSVLVLAGAAVLGWCAWVWCQVSQAQRAGHEWINETPAVPTSSRPVSVSPPALVRAGDVLGELAIPRIHVSVVIREGDSDRVLRIGAGHIPGTAWLGAAGNMAIAAHRDTFFRPLRWIRRDDRITLRTRGGTSRYVVSDVEIVPPSATDVLSPGPNRDLTLVTCYPFSYLGAAPRRFIVHARRIS